MTDPRRVPVVVAAAQVVSRGAVRSPLDLAIEAVREAGERPLLTRLDTVLAVDVASWPVASLAGLVASAVGASPRVTYDAPVGGQWPARLLDRAAAAVAAGESEVALVVGAEAQASVRTLHGGTPPGWPEPVERTFDPAAFGSPQALAAGLLLPTRVYPMFEQRLTADLGLTLEQGARWSAELYAALSQVASRNPAAWTPEVRTADRVFDVGPRNRMVSEPYPLAVNAMPNVDQAAAVLVASQAFAHEQGLPVLAYVWGGAGVDDTVDLLAREAYGVSRALCGCLDAVRRIGPLDLLDVYSCFPVVPKLATEHLGLPRDTVLSVTGGHASFGGPLSTYGLHAVVAVVQALRAGAQTGVVHANGGMLTYQHAIVLGRQPHEDGYVGDPEPRLLQPAGPGIAPPAEGVLTIETATVEHDRDAGPARAFLVGRDETGLRAAASTDDPRVADQLSQAHGSPLDRRVRTVPEGEARRVVEVLGNRSGARAR